MCKLLSNIWGLFSLTNKEAWEEIPPKNASCPTMCPEAQSWDQ